MEGALPIAIPSVLDLDGVDENQRAETWAANAPALMPGIAIRRIPFCPSFGQMRRIALGCGWLWYIRSAPVLVHYTPPRLDHTGEPTFSLLTQVNGRLASTQRDRTCELNPGDMCMIDGRHPFQLESRGETEIIVLQMPRDAVLGSHPYLEHRTACLFEADDAGTMLLRDTVFNMIQAAPALAENQRCAAVASIVQLLGVPDLPRSLEQIDVHWRVRSALSYIEMRFADPHLTANDVARAQGISRRRLDQILQDAINVSLSAQIWNRRLAEAATYLTDPSRINQTVAQIAYATGYEDASHFTRAFKRRYGHSPRQWREITHIS